MAVICVALSLVFMPCDYRIRLFWCCAPGALLLFAAHPVALMFALISFLFSSGIFLLGKFKASSYIATRIPYLILLLLLAPDIFQLLREKPLLWLGSAFFIIRQMMTVAQGIKKSSSTRDFFPALCLATFFFAALPSGPVFNGLTCWDTLKQNRAPNFSSGSYRLFEGFVYLFAVTGFIDLLLNTISLQQEQRVRLNDWALHLPLHLLVVPIASFCLLFSTFYGYSRMAEGCAQLFGFEVPENFNKPHLARDLGDFWQRWHRSMAEFVMQYIYLPLLVSGLSTRVSIFTAFIFMGLWHDLSLNFLIWGIGHGAGLALLLPWIRKQSLPPMIPRLLSLSYVIYLSGIAHGIPQGISHG
jgi:D-alanyl-lipoteichoic acid acyltransferase DltB (MBOAT superfamily)